MRWGSISSELLVCGGGVHSILLLPFVFVFMSVVVTVWGSVGMFVV